MAQETRHAASSRGSSGNSSRRTSSGSSQASRRTTGSGSRPASSRRNPRSTARPRTRAAPRPRATPSRDGSPTERASEVGSSAASGFASAAKNVVLPAVTAALGAAAGVLVERRHRRPRKVLGIPLPGSRNGGDLAKEIRRAGEQFGHLASEVRTTRKKAEDIGKAMS
jgi:hypothetical protein